MAGHEPRGVFPRLRPPAIASYWFAPAHERAPGGESFNDLFDRTVAGIASINRRTCRPGHRLRVARWPDQGGDRACTWT